MDGKKFLTGAAEYPFPTPEASIDPACQALYDEWLRQREATANVTTERITTSC